MTEDQSPIPVVPHDMTQSDNYHEGDEKIEGEGNGGRYNMKKKKNGWEELMGSDLLIKSLSYMDETTTTGNASAAANIDGSTDGNTTTTTTTNTMHHHNKTKRNVQLHDVVVIDFVGYECNDTIRQQLFDIGTDGGVDGGGGGTTTMTDNDSNNRISLLLSSLPIFHHVQDMMCDIGDQDLIPALEMGIRFMHLITTTTTMNDDTATNDDNDTTITTTTTPTKAVIYSHSKYAYGLSTRTYTNHTTNDNTNCKYTLPSLSNVVYQVTLKQIITSPPILPTTTYDGGDADGDGTNNRVDPHVFLQLCHFKKQLANDIYLHDITTTTMNAPIAATAVNGGEGSDGIEPKPNQQNNNMYHLHRAVRIYQRTIDKLENFIIDLHQQQLQQHEEEGECVLNNNDQHNDNRRMIEEAQQIQIDCWNNISAVYMKCQLYHKAKEACIQTLIKDNTNIKALFRAAKASLYDPASNYNEVETAIHAVQEQVELQQQQQQQGGNDTNAIMSMTKDLQSLQREYQLHQHRYKQQQKEMASRIHNTLTTQNNKKKKTNVHVTTPMSTLPTATLVGLDNDNNDSTIATATETKTTQISHCNTSDGHTSALLNIFVVKNKIGLLYNILRITIVFIMVLYLYIFYSLRSNATIRDTSEQPSTHPQQQEEL